MQPDLATIFSGTNDVVARRFDLASVAADMEHIQRALVDAGATVLTFTLPDLTPVLPLARPLAPRILAMNEALRSAAARTGTILLDFATYPVATDPRLWSEDRIHANALGHERIARALAHALRLPGADDSWKDPLPVRPPPSRVARWRGELAWASRHLWPWIARALVGSGVDRPRRPKRPDLTPIG